jgi:hypothetical protein
MWMDNQHRQIKGYRELNESEIAAMNEIKQKGVVLGELVASNGRTLQHRRDGLADRPDGAHALIEHAPRSPHCDGNLTVLPAREIASHGARSVYVVPYQPGHLSVSLDTAKRIIGDKANAYYAEAAAVIACGKQYWIWA